MCFKGSDSEGTEEPVVGNVNKFAVVPPGYTGRPKKGHLIFDACFESGVWSDFKFKLKVWILTPYSTIFPYSFELNDQCFTF